MRIALIQQHATSDRGENIGRGIAAAECAAAEGVRLVAFAELAFTPFYPRNPSCGAPPLELAEEIPGPTTQAFCDLARRLGIVVVLNLYERDGDCAFDSSPVIDADGRLLGVTRMLHIAEMSGFHEQGYYAPGDRGMPVYHTAAGRLGVAICYDRHYPEVMRALSLGGAEIVVIASGKEEAKKQWDQQEGNLIANAILSDFKTDIIVISNGRKDLLDVMDNSNRFKKELFDDKNSGYAIYKIVQDKDKN